MCTDQLLGENDGISRETLEMALVAMKLKLDDINKYSSVFNGIAKPNAVKLEKAIAEIESYLKTLGD